MAGGSGRRVLQALVAVIGAVAVLTGVVEVVFGSRLFTGTAPVVADVDSQYRFFASFWLGAGLVALWVVPRIEPAAGPLRLVMGLMFLGGLSRLVSWVMVGVPQPMIITLLALELVVPPIVVFWQSRLAAASEAASAQV
ncbi:MAG: DUF4345 domain-containing protein [Micromonosporaceae bacterium]